MKIKLENNIQGLMGSRKVSSWQELSELLESSADYKRTRSALSRYCRKDNPAYAMDFIEAICNTLQCLPNDLFNITLTVDEEEYEKITSQTHPFEFGSINLNRRNEDQEVDVESSKETHIKVESKKTKDNGSSELDFLLGGTVTHLSAGEIKGK